jgi:nucleoside-diphosphate-sugar epimerase
MKILLVGATGQIGYALLQALHAAGHAVTVLVRDAHKLPFPDGVRVVAAPVFDPAAFATALQGQDAAVYGVGLPEQFTFDAGVFEQVNLGLLREFCAALGSSAVRRWLYVSTYEVFAPQQGLIRESHPVADPAAMSPYFAAMTRAYLVARECAAAHGVALTTLHPAAVYGGLDTGDGVTHVLENLLHARAWRLPTVLPGRFPVVHVASLAQAIVRALGHPGAFIVSDGMTSLGELARAQRREAGRGWVPPSIPRGLAYATVRLIEAVARLLRVRPILATVQLDFITAGHEPRADRAREVLGWQPWPLEHGLRTFLAERARLPDRRRR